MLQGRYRRVKGVLKVVTLYCYKGVMEFNRDITQELHRVVTLVLYCCYTGATRLMKGCLLSICNLYSTEKNYFIILVHLVL